MEKDSSSFLLRPYIKYIQSGDIPRPGQKRSVISSPEDPFRQPWTYTQTNNIEFFLQFEIEIEKIMLIIT